MGLSPEVKRALTERFNAKLPLKAAALSYARAALDLGGPSAKTAVRRLAHQLAGTGATFGWPEISMSASRVETCDDTELPAALEQLITFVREALVEAKVSSRILLVEDHAIYADYLQAGLAAPERSFEVAGTAQDAMDRLAQRPYDLILLDILLPDADGRSVLIKLQENPATSTTPVIVLSQVREATIESECLAYGAEAFFDKAVPIDRLSTAMANALARHHEHRATSRHDVATGLLNRAGLREAFNGLQSARRGKATPAALALLDIDHFKQVVEGGGSDAGNRALELLVQCLREDLRANDLVARWGQDEIAVAFPDMSAPRAMDTLERVQDRFSSLTTADGETMTFSGGVVDIDPSAELELVVSRADQLLYAAKRTGRDKIAGSGLELTTPRPRLLVAEDDDDMAALVVDILVDAGFEVDREADGHSALQLATTRRYAAIIIDRTMPKMDGYELIERLRADRRNRTVPIVVLTAANAETDIALAFELGADDYVHKPFKAVELVARVQRLALRSGNRHSTAEYDAFVASR
jgi:two-component system, cell cycle response regulator